MYVNAVFDYRVHFPSWKDLYKSNSLQYFNWQVSLRDEDNVWLYIYYRKQLYLWNHEMESKSYSMHVSIIVITLLKHAICAYSDSD